MRVITGRYKGRRLRAVRDDSIRPVADRVKQTIFDMLSQRLSFDGIRVLDLFAGTGALGIEALSRGAGHAWFIDNNRASLQCIRDNLAELGCASSATLLGQDALRFAKTTEESFELIFADPPYRFGNTAGIPPLLFSRQTLRHGGYLLIEHTKQTSFSDTELFAVQSTKRFGSTTVTFFTYPAAGKG